MGVLAGEGGGVSKVLGRSIHENNGFLFSSVLPLDLIRGQIQSPCVGDKVDSGIGLRSTLA